MSSANKNSRLQAVPCYVSGKGMFASQQTWHFKTTVITILEAYGLGYDTRYRYYQPHFPALSEAELARLICDPIEYYDHDWPPYRAGDGASYSEAEASTRFMLARDRHFQEQARVAIYAFNEAGFGSGVNCMRFLQAGKSILGFYDPERLAAGLNLSNILQLKIDFPQQVTLCQCHNDDILSATLVSYLNTFRHEQ